MTLPALSLTTALGLLSMGLAAAQSEPLSEKEIQVSIAKLASVEFPIASTVLHETINLPFPTGRYDMYSRDDSQWICPGKIHDNWTIRFRLNKSKQKYLDFQILYFHARSKEISERASDIGHRICTYAAEDTLPQLAISQEVEDIVVMPKLFTERLASISADLVRATVTVTEQKVKLDSPSHILSITGGKTSVTIPLRFDPGLDQFHIVPGFQITPTKP
ncbi:MAG: hypothetical protein AAF226_07050 [Verrucomicrobiota bacterium]